MWSLHILPVSAWVSSRSSGFLPQSKDVRVRWIGHVKLPLSARGITRVYIWGYGEKDRDGIVVGAGLMGQIASFCIVDSMIL